MFSGCSHQHLGQTSHNDVAMQCIHDSNDSIMIVQRKVCRTIFVSTHENCFCQNCMHKTETTTEQIEIHALVNKMVRALSVI